MIKLRICWQQACQACGTELAVDLDEQSPMTCLCPWCGGSVAVEIPDGKQDAREKLLAAVHDLEVRINEDYSP